MAGYVGRDLSSRLPGQSLMELAVDGESAGVMGNIIAGLTGEQKTAIELDRLGSEYKVAHSIPIPGERRDLDHLVVGPTGVFVINSKNHLGQSILVDDEYIIYNRNRYQEPSDAARDARRAAGRLGLKKAIPVVAVWGASGIVVKSSYIARVCSTQRLLELITDGSRVLGPEQIEEIYRRVIEPDTWGIDATSLRDPALVAEQYSACRNKTVTQKYGHVRPKTRRVNNRKHDSLTEAHARRRVTRAFSIFVGLILIVWGVGGSLGSTQTQVKLTETSSPAPQSAAPPPAASNSDDPTSLTRVTGGSRDGSTLESVRLGTYLYVCDGRRVSVATPVGDTVNGQTFFFVPPSKIAYCVKATVFHYGVEGVVNGVDPVRGLLQVTLISPITGYRLGALPAPGVYKYALTTTADIQLVETTVSERNDALMADVDDVDAAFVPGSPLFNQNGELVGILDYGGVVISTKRIT
jgi:hypothetical protein